MVTGFIMSLLKSNLKIKSFSFDASVNIKESSDDSEPEETQRPKEKRIKKKSKRKSERSRAAEAYKTAHVAKDYDTKNNYNSNQTTEAVQVKRQKQTTQSINFEIDTVGEQLNLKYGTVYGVPIPSFNRWGDCILGSNSTWKIDGMKHKYLVLSKTIQKRIKYQDFHQKVSVKVKGKDENMSQDFISFQDIYKEKVQEESFQVPVEDEEFKKNSHTLNNNVQSDPYNLENWLKLIQFQDQLAKNKGDLSKDSLNRGIQEKKMYMYEKALEYLPENEVLISKYLSLCTKILGDAEILQKWDLILKENDSFRLWNEYITFRISNFASFSINAILQVFEECFIAQSKDIKDSKNQENLLYIFTRLAVFLYQAGKEYRL